MKHRFLKTLASLALAAGMTVWPSADAAAQVVTADFTGGNGSVSADQYQGIPGNGWKTAWAFNGGSEFTAAVLNDNPMSGNYLSLSRTDATANAAKLTRTVENSFLDTALAHKIEFTIRLDDVGTRMSVGIGGFTSAASASNWNWFVQADVNSNRWYFYDGTTGVSVPATGLNAINPVEGRSYDFTIDVDPVAKKWTGTISDGVNSYTSGLLNFRNTGASSDELFALSLGSSNLVPLALSLDSLSYSVVPEPSSLALLAAVALGTVVFASRRAGRTTAR